MGKGDHIYAKRPHHWVRKALEHHGIDLGDNTVVHFACCDAIDGGGHMIVRTNMKAFSKNGEVGDANQIYEKLRNNNAYLNYRDYWYRKQLIKYCDAPELDSDLVVKLALANLGKGDCKVCRGEDKVKYETRNQNCEHFATYMKKNIAYSEQLLIAADNARSPGHILAVIVEEWLRKRDSRQKIIGEKYIGSIYRANNLFFFESYIKPFGLPPVWYVAHEIIGEWQDSHNWNKLNNQKDVPYPLQELISISISESGEYIYQNIT